MIGHAGRSVPAFHGDLVAKGLRNAHVGPFDLTIRPGECLAVTGRSGSGKSLLLRMIADLDPHEGEVRLGETDQRAIPAHLWRRHVLYCPAEPGWWSDRVMDHFDNPKTLHPLVEALGLAARVFDTPLHRLSTGERQRLALIRALCRMPRVLLLDEPTAALDEQTTLRLEDVLRGRMRDGMTLLLASHDAGQVTRLADRHRHIDNGIFEPAP